MENQCNGCKHHRNDNNQMLTEGNITIAGNFCLKFKWNLISMTKFPENCFQKGVGVGGLF